MKIDFVLPADGKMHRFCFICHEEGAVQVQNNGITQYFCDKCSHTSERALYFNNHRFWVDESKELWHESAGVFLRNKRGEYLFFQRTEYPLSLTIPAGHVDEGEAPETTAARELTEEVDIHAPELHYLGAEDVWGDSCSAGADVHKWHTYIAQLRDNPTITIKEEGEKPVWLTLARAKDSDLAYVINQMVLLYEKELSGIPDIPHAVADTTYQSP